MNGPIHEEPAPQEAPASFRHDPESLSQESESGADPSAAARRRWVEANRDRIRESNRRWRLEHLDRARELNRESERPVRVRNRRLAEQRAGSRERAARWRAGHLDEVRDYQVQWVERNRDKVRGYYNHYYKAHRDEVNARAADRRDADPEPMKLARKAWAERNKERLAELQRARRSDPAVYQAQLEANAAARRLKRRLASAGLPLKQLHQVTAAERRALAQDAANYFSDPDLSEHVRQRTVLTESLTKHVLENGSEMREFAKAFVATRARMGLPPVSVDDIMYARAVEYVVNHLQGTSLLSSRDIAAAVRSSKATVQLTERDRQVDRLVKTVVAHVNRHRGRLDEEAAIENRARALRGLPPVTVEALLVRLAVQEVVEALPTDQLRNEDLRSAIRKAQFHIAASTHGNADNTNAMAFRMPHGRKTLVRVR